MLGGLTPGREWQPTPFLFLRVAPPRIRRQGLMCASGRASTAQALFTCLTNSHPLTTTWSPGGWTPRRCR